MKTLWRKIQQLSGQQLFNVLISGKQWLQTPARAGAVSSAAQMLMDTHGTSSFQRPSTLLGCRRILYNHSCNLIRHYLKSNVSVWPPAPCNVINPFHSRFLPWKLQSTAQPRNGRDGLQESLVWQHVPERSIYLINISDFTIVKLLGKRRETFLSNLRFFPLDCSTVHECTICFLIFFKF